MCTSDSLHSRDLLETSERFSSEVRSVWNLQRSNHMYSDSLAMVKSTLHMFNAGIL